MSKDIIEISCPFCGKGKILLHHHGSVKKYVGGPYGGGKNKVFQSEEKAVVGSDCLVCGKNSKDIQKKLYEKKEVPHEEKLKRFKEAGLPTRFEG